MDATPQAVVRNNGWELAEGPNVEGVVLVNQSAWPEDVIEAFHRVPWLNAASIRMPWRELEPRDEEFDWSAIDRVLEEVKKWNEKHPDAPRTMHLRVMAGVFSPAWFEEAGVKYYTTHHLLGPAKKKTPLHIPMAYDNPEFMKQLREVYRAMYERYKDEPLITVYHGTWSAGPWDEIFHPMGDQPYPPDYTKEKFVQGMVEQLDILIEEFALKGMVCELPYSGKYPSRDLIDITGPLTSRIVERLGKRSPFLYIQTNGWGEDKAGVPQPTAGHVEDLMLTYGNVNLAFQAIGSNAGGGWWPQGDWVNLMDPAKQFEVSYLEIYPPDLIPLDEKHRITEGFTRVYKPYLKERNRRMYVREGHFTQSFRIEGEPQKLERLWVAEAAPAGTSVSYKIRTRRSGSQWSDWAGREDAGQLPAGNEVEVQGTLHTDDGYFTPRVADIRPYWKKLAEEAATRDTAPGTPAAK